jgi:hypothetical protein
LKGYLWIVEFVFNFHKVVDADGPEQLNLILYEKESSKIAVHQYFDLNSVKVYEEVFNCIVYKQMHIMLILYLRVRARDQNEVVFKKRHDGTDYRPEYWNQQKLFNLFLRS